MSWVFSARDERPELNEAVIEIIDATDLNVKAEGLAVICNSATPSPYVTVKDVKGLVGDTQNTKVASDSMNPVWNESFSYRFNHKLSAFKLKVKDSNSRASFAGNDSLAKTNLPIHDLFEKAKIGEPLEIDLSLPLKEVAGEGCCLASRSKLLSAKLNVKAKITFNIPLVLPGTSITLPSRHFQIGLSWEFKKKQLPIDLDASLIGLDSGGNIVDQVWYNNKNGFGSEQTGFAVQHTGDTSEDGSGDDETITVDTDRLPQSVEKLAVVINSSSGKSLSSVKYAYIRIIVDGKTLAFYALGQGRIPHCTGLLFGCMMKAGLFGGHWVFVTTAVEADGPTVNDSKPAIMAYGKAKLGW